MCKKVLIAAAAVLVGLLVVKGTWLGSHACRWWNDVGQSVKNAVPPEQEIARLRMELSNLKKDDDRHVDAVARLAVDVEKLEAELGEVKTNLTREEARIGEAFKGMGKGDFVVHRGQRYTRGELGADALAFKAAERAAKSKEDALTAKRQVLALEKKKLGELGSVRAEMAAELEQLESALAQERHAQAARESTIDDAGYKKIRKDLEAVRERVNVLKKKRELRGELRLNPEVSDRQRQQDVEAAKYLEARFGEPAKQVADGK